MIRKLVALILLVLITILIMKFGVIVWTVGESE